MREWGTRAAEWSPPSRWKRVLAVDAHTAGEPLRVVIDGFPELAGATVLERRREALRSHDGLRRALMWEPRGHADMYGCIVTPPATERADFGVLFTHNEGFSTMCGHGIIGVATVLVELGLVPATGPDVVLGIDTPAGFVSATVRVRAGRAESVSFLNVPSFVFERAVDVRVDGVGSVRCDLAFGGAFYAYVDAASVGLDLVPEQLALIVEAGRAVKAAVVARGQPSHPLEPDLGFLYGTIFTAPARAAGVHSRNVCVFADGEVDRSPTGTGVSGRAALQHEAGALAVGETLRIESILGTTFDVRVTEETRVGGRAAVVPEVTGRAFLTGRNELWIDPDDPLAGGFLLGPPSP